jgi:preprotein translocase subunit YajC
MSVELAIAVYMLGLSIIISIVMIGISYFLRKRRKMMKDMIKKMQPSTLNQKSFFNLKEKD